MRKLVLAKAELKDSTHPMGFVYREWSEVVDAWQLHDWESYRDVPRVGTGAPLAIAKREQLWAMFKDVRDDLGSNNNVTINDAYGWLTEHFADPANNSPFTHVVVDEAQDLSVAQLRFLSVLSQKHVDGLFFAGDLGQRIFRAPFSWSSLGVDVRGRSTTLRVNYRTSHQIRSQADRLLDPEISDVDGNLEKRNNAQSVFNGEAPRIVRAHSSVDEESIVGDWILECLNRGMPEEQIAVFVRAEARLSRARSAVAHAGTESCQLDERLRTSEGCITLSTMHLAKGLEFRAVAVMALDEDIIPDKNRLSFAIDMAQT